MTITKRLLMLDPSLEIHNEGHWDKPFDPNKIGFASFNDAGIECETGEFLYSLVRLLKPLECLETGTHWGVGASYIGMALKDNKQGHLDTIEFLPEIHMRASQRIVKLGLTEQVTCHYGDAAKFDPHISETGLVNPGKYGFILLDTEPQTRFAELIKFFPYLSSGGFVFIHDLHRHMHQIPNEEHGFAWPYGVLPQQIKDWVNDGALRPFHFTTPRGFTGFYKPSSEDYNWR